MSASPSRERYSNKLILDRTPPLNGELPDLNISLRNPRDEAPLAIDDTDKPVVRNVMCAEEAQEALFSHGDGQDTKRLPVPKDGNLHAGNPILRARTFHDTRYDNGARREGLLLSLKRVRTTLRQRLTRRDQSMPFDSGLYTACPALAATP